MKSNQYQKIVADKMEMKKIAAWFFVLILLFGGVCICTMYI